MWNPFRTKKEGLELPDLAYNPILRWLKWVCIVGVAAAACWFIYSKSNLHRDRLIAQARGFMKQEDFPRAVLLARRVLQEDNRNVEALMILAEVFGKKDPRSAVFIYRQIIELRPEDLDIRLAAAATAVQARRIVDAVEFLNVEGFKDSTDIDFLKLSGTIALETNNVDLAVLQFRKAAELHPEETDALFSSAYLGIINDDPNISDESYRVLIRLSEVPEWELEAAPAIVRGALSRGDEELALEKLRLLLEREDTSLSNRIFAMDQLHKLRPVELVAYLEKPRSLRFENVASLYMYCNWLNENGFAKKVAEILVAEGLENSDHPALSVALAESRIRSGEWEVLIRELEGRNWEALEFIRNMILAKARKQLDPNYSLIMDRSRWASSINKAKGVEHILNRFAAKCLSWGWTLEAEQIWWALVFSKNASEMPYQNLFRLLFGLKRTESLRQLMEIDLIRNPDNPERKNNFATFSLLLDKDIEKSLKLAEEIYREDPENPAYASTYAFALWKRNRIREALELIDKPQFNPIQHPGFLLYKCLILHSNGELIRAERCFDGIKDFSHLLPEELELLRSIGFSAE